MPRIRVSVQCLGERHSLVKFNSRVAIITQALKRPGKGGRLARMKAAYLGFESYAEAQAAAQELRRQFPKARMQVRKAERLSTAFEVKFSHLVAEQLIWNMLREMETATQRIERHLKVVATRPSVQPDPPVDRYRVPQVSRNRGATVTVGAHTLSID